MFERFLEFGFKGICFLGCSKPLTLLNVLLETNSFLLIFGEGKSQALSGRSLRMITILRFSGCDVCVDCFKVCFKDILEFTGLPEDL